MVRKLREDDFAKLHRAFIAAFSGYKVSLNPTEVQFRRRLYEKTNIREDLSGIEIINDIRAFVLHGLNDYQDIPTAYNGGTGTVPDYRRKGYIANIYSFLIPKIKAAGARRILLEVITSNKPAIHLYRKLGFRYTRTFKCFKGVPKHSDITNFNFEEINEWNPGNYSGFKDFEPSFIDSDGQVPYNWRNETLIEARLENQLVGYALFQQNLGRITQMAVRPANRGQGIGRSLLYECYVKCGQPLSFLNIPEPADGMISFLLASGLRNELDQYEMELLI